MRSFFIAAAALAASLTSASAQQIWLTMDQVRPYKLEKPADSVVIGNPAIADVRVQDNANLLLFGKGPGLTNMYFFDENGETLQNLIVRVRTPSTDMLTVHRGSSRTTYNCTTNCEATVTVGDDAGIFNTVAGQMQQKFGQAADAASGGN